MFTTDQKGSLAELKVMAAAAALGVVVLKPLSDGARYDLVLDVGRLVRVQCKWAPKRGDVLVVNCRTCRRGPNGAFLRRTYSSRDADLIAAYCPDVDACYAIPIELAADRPSIILRLGPTRNNQVVGINWAKDYEFAATLSRLVGP